MRRWHFPALITTLIVPTLAAEIFTPPSSWRKPNITSSRDDRVSAANNAIQQALKSLPTGTFASSDFYGVVADFDALRNQTQYKAITTAMVSGTTAMRAYKVYGNQNMLDLAVDAWAYGRAHTISEADVAAGRIPGKAFDLTTTCEGVTMAGGTFWQISENETTIAGFSTGLFFMLSSYLAEVTFNQMYLNAARESGAFMVATLNVTKEGNGKGAMSAKAGDPCTRDSFGAGPFRLDGARMFIEGLAVLPPDTLIGTETVETLRRTMVNTTLLTNALCNAPNGIINKGDGEGDLGLVNALAVLHERLNTTQSPLRTYIQQFLGYNAVVDLSTINGSNIYGGAWSGPPSPTFSIDNQTRALAALNGGILLPITLSSSTPNLSPDDGGDKSSPVGAIAGGVVGGLVLICAIVMLLLLLRRRQRQRQREHQEAADNIAVYEPFMATAPPSTFAVTTAPRDNEKRRQPAQAQAWGHQASSSTSAPSNSESSRTRPQESRDDIPTEELLEMLQHRIGVELQGAQAPPAYDSQPER
ncbi:hypothetical protein FPV67DRAFT_1665996 [Lyophyllum atratum]|nr:hypothetical protein FPV67DRAFT_1665996 [Lyophyllum atratum]